MSSFSTTFTELPPSCLQFAPGDKDILVAGTYYLDATEQRTGNTVTEQNEDEEMQQAKIKPEVQKKSGQLLLYRKIGHDLCVFFPLLIVSYLKEAKAE